MGTCGCQFCDVLSNKLAFFQVKYSIMSRTNFAWQIMLLVSLVQPQRIGNEKITKATVLISKAKTLIMQHNFWADFLPVLIGIAM